VPHDEVVQAEQPDVHLTRGLSRQGFADLDTPAVEIPVEVETGSTESAPVLAAGRVAASVHLDEGPCADPENVVEWGARLHPVRHREEVHPGGQRRGEAAARREPPVVVDGEPGPGGERRGKAIRLEDGPVDAGEPSVPRARAGAVVGLDGHPGGLGHANGEDVDLSRLEARPAVDVHEREGSLDRRPVVVGLDVRHDGQGVRVERSAAPEPVDRALQAERAVFTSLGVRHPRARLTDEQAGRDVEPGDDVDVADPAGRGQCEGIARRLEVDLIHETACPGLDTVDQARRVRVARRHVEAEPGDTVPGGIGDLDGHANARRSSVDAEHDALVGQRLGNTPPAETSRSASGRHTPDGLSPFQDAASRRRSTSIASHARAHFLAALAVATECPGDANEVRGAGRGLRTRSPRYRSARSAQLASKTHSTHASWPAQSASSQSQRPSRSSSKPLSQTSGPPG
jgi:hypothetical protein